MSDKKMISNIEIFFDFLARNYMLSKYVVAFTKRYNMGHVPFYLTIKKKADSNPKGLFVDILGTGHKFKKLEKKWIEYADRTICYIPKKGDKVYCSCFAEETLAKVFWIATFCEGTKECFTDMSGKVHDSQTFVEKYEDA